MHDKRLRGAMRPIYLVSVLSFSLLAQCSNFPELPQAPPAGNAGQGDPVLLPIPQLLQSTDTTQAEDQAALIQARAARLRSKARALQAAALSARERRILNAAINRHSR